MSEFNLRADWTSTRILTPTTQIKEYIQILHRVFYNAFKFGCHTFLSLNTSNNFVCRLISIKKILKYLEEHAKSKVNNSDIPLMCGLIYNRVLLSSDTFPRCMVAMVASGCVWLLWLCWLLQKQPMFSFKVNFVTYGQKQILFDSKRCIIIKVKWS